MMVESQIPFVTQGTIPELAIAGPDSSVDEGEEVTFTITANNSTNVDLAIPVAITDHASRTNADFVDELTYYAHLASGSTTATLTIPTNTDATAENDGVVSATIQADSGTAGYTIKSSSGTGYADVWDNDGPTPVIVSVTPNTTPVNEGTKANFTISRTGATTNALSVRYRVLLTEVSTNDIRSNTVSIPAGESTLPVELNLVDSGTVLSIDANISLKILSPREYNSATYRVDEDLQVARVQVTDNNQPIFISTEYTNVVPGETIHLQGGDDSSCS